VRSARDSSSSTRSPCRGSIRPLQRIPGRLSRPRAGAVLRAASARR